MNKRIFYCIPGKWFDKRTEEFSGNLCVPVSMERSGEVREDMLTEYITQTGHGRSGTRWWIYLDET